MVGDEHAINAFRLEGELINREYQYNFNNDNLFFTDDQGNSSSIFGNVISGQDQGTTLSSSVSVVSYWFAIAAFYPDPDIYVNE